MTGMPRVLIVDDSEDNLYYLRTLLGAYGYEVESAVHGAEALEKARHSPPGLVISDLLMPVMDGYTLLRQWRLDDHLRNIPFVVYTATYTSPEDETLAVNLGADAFIVKPKEPDEFMAAIGHVLSRATGAGARSVHMPEASDPAIVKQYSAALVRKLEDKNAELTIAIEHLGELNEHLERRVEERTRQLKEKQAQIIQAEKMAAVGRLAASMAHEINNPLQAITLHLQLMADEMQSPETARQLNIVQQEFNRIAGIVERLLDFQRPQAGEMQPINILATLETILTLADKQLERTGIDLVRLLPVELPLVAAVENQMKQVFLNLVLNAAEVMPEGGTLTIAARREDDEIIIEFADSGPGLDEETAARIFEPFFTTKSDGSGLGLAISHEIVANHDGTLTAASRPGGGAVFTVTLPVCRIVLLRANDDQQ